MKIARVMRGVLLGGIALALVVLVILMFEQPRLPPAIEGAAATISVAVAILLFLVNNEQAQISKSLVKLEGARNEAVLELDRLVALGGESKILWAEVTNKGGHASALLGVQVRSLTDTSAPQWFRLFEVELIQPRPKGTGDYLSALAKTPSAKFHGVLGRIIQPGERAGLALYFPDDDRFYRGGLFALKLELRLVPIIGTESRVFAKSHLMQSIVTPGFECRTYALARTREELDAPMSIVDERFERRPLPT